LYAYNLLRVYKPYREGENMHNNKNINSLHNNKIDSSQDKNVYSSGSNDFRTFSEYMKKDDNSLTASMEDYLEMIYRLSINAGFTRIHELSDALNVQPPSATKMVQRLGDMNFLKYERYGVILLKDAGVEKGQWLLRRHNTIEAFLRLLEIPEKTILEETEKIEHTIDAETIKCFEEYVNFIKDNPQIIAKFNTYKSNRHNNNTDLSGITETQSIGE
jgi:Mn-dependent DtxR family transcriptional regulator